MKYDWSPDNFLLDIDSLFNLEIPLELPVTNESEQQEPKGEETPTKQSNDSTSQNRFKEFSKNELKNILDEAESKRTKETTKWALNVFNRKSYFLKTISSFPFKILGVFFTIRQNQ